MSRAVELAKECGLLAEENQGAASCIWTDGCAGVSQTDIEAFYHAARAEALMEAAEEFDSQKVMVLQPLRTYSAQDICDNTKQTYSRVVQKLRAMADREGK